MRHDLYRIDDLLLRAGAIAVLLVFGTAATLVLVGLAQGGSGSTDPGLEMLGRHALPLALASACPIALLWAGVAMRRREKRTLAFWRLLQQNAEIAAPDLIANSDYTRADLERAVRLLNNKGLGFYIWSRDTDVIRDGRLEASYLHVEKCDVCNASISLQVPASLRETPRCPYCGDPIPIESLQKQKREALDRLRTENRPAEGRPGPGSFSLVVFVVLLFAFWPAAVAYGWYKWQS